MEKRDVLGATIKCLVLLTGAAVVMLGCGGGSGQCGGNSTCGGNLVGAWNIETLCPVNVSSTMTGGACSQIAVNTLGLRETGTVIFNADLTYTTNATVSGSLLETIPGSCLTISGTTVSCTQLNMSLQAVSDGGLTADCTTAAGGSCSCSVQFPSQTSTTAGTYSISGSTVTLNPTGGTASTSNYCVQGSTLTLASMAMSMPGVTTQGSAEIVLTKQ